MSAFKPSAATLQAIQWLSEQQPALVRTLGRWCQQNSWSYDTENLHRMADLLVDDFAVLDLAAQRVSLPPWFSIDDRGLRVEHATGPVLRWDYRPEAPRRILLAIHYDTVYPPGSQPAEVTIEGSRMRGPGVADAKGGIAMIRYAMEAMLRFHVLGHLGITILLNPDEEIGSPASQGVWQVVAQEVRTALLFEPALPDGSLVRNRKGSGNFSVIVHGRAAHAGRNPQQGRNAIVLAARIALELDSWNSDSVTVNVGRVHGGGPLNQVPHLALLHFNVRVDSIEQQLEIERRLNLLAKTSSESEGFTVQVEGQFHSPPKQVAGSPEFQHLQSLLADVCGWQARALAWQDTGGACDGNRLTKLGVCNVDTMGPVGGELHSSAEYCEIPSLITSASTVVALLAALDAEARG